MMLDIHGSGLGAEIHGIDPANPTGIDAGELREAIYRHKLVVLKDFNPTPEQFLAFGRHLGEVRKYYEPIYHHPEYPEIFVSSNDQSAGGVPKTGAFWHIDYQFMPEPFAFTMTLPLAVPGTDRGTYFVDLTQAWAQVPEELKQRVRGTRSVNSPRRYVKIRPSDVYRPIGEVLQEIEEVTPPQYWPTALKHPVTGEEYLYICEAFTESIYRPDPADALPSSPEGRGAGKGEPLKPDVLTELLHISGQSADINPETHPLVHTQHFGVGDALLWDNRVLTHRAKHGSTPGTVTTHRLTMVDGHPTPGLPA
ncbi:TauD/TfdA dioxygenase family protein [Corynebacterium heidelbergense]|uniref:Taurine catabolism dioxygenase n=1 Tax=Corynebacterium heidelbergense TaxID=2055947 RepID=A0A364V979_9CORY|nr:TauD/TfdA family dioxygenase [Corynebacterium heidelbergense]RAV33181.1 taurine catabolism dioxygenase [Corynebacterium heidelbergense]